MAKENSDSIDQTDPTKPEGVAGIGKVTKPGDESGKKDKKDKSRKITEKDFKKVETLLKMELGKRKSSQFRQKHERMWKVVDRQVTLTPNESEEGGPDEEWLNSFELGVLAQASETMTGDLLRVIFPDARNWFEPHIEPPLDLDVNTGEKIPMDKKLQSVLDGRLRALMTQQHINFGLRDRVELSLKEALHHGSFVAEVDEEIISMYLTGDRVKDITSPVWIPHSMWNCYPDPSPALVGSSMFYAGSMFIRSYSPRHKFLESATGDGWIKGALKKIPKNEHTVNENQTKDLEIDTYWGDVVIPASGDGMQSSDEDMYFPNHKAVFANGKLVYLDANKTPYPPVIYKGYERMDVRDPYAFSPIIKQSPMQNITTVLANEFVNSVQLNARPPIVYDANDPDFIVNGGPTISPGAKTPSKGSATFQQLKIGDPSIALKGVEFGLSEMKKSLGRPGIEVGSRATKAEVDTKQADSEAGPFSFAIKADDALRTFLYMQHAMNLSKKDFAFSYYCGEMDSPDFLRATRKDLPETVHFEVVGSKGILGEAKRHAAFSNVTSHLMGNPSTAAKLDVDAIIKQMFQDAGIKAPERFLKETDGIPPEVKQQMQQASKMIDDLKAQLAEAQGQEALKAKKVEYDHEARMTKIQVQHSAEVADLHLKSDRLQSDHAIAMGKQSSDLKAAGLEKMIREFEHTVAVTVAKHTAKPAEPTPGAMGVVTHPTVNADGHELYRDAEGNHAYVGPNGEITEVPNAV